MEKIIIKNARGQSATLSYDGALIIKAYDGFSNSGVYATASTGYRQHGSTLNYQTLSPRLMSIDILVLGDTMSDVYKGVRDLSSLFNPLLGSVELTYSNDYISKSITALTTGMPRITDRKGGIQEMRVELTAFDPFWYDTSVNEAILEDYYGGLSFPLKTALHTFATIGDSVTINNIGDWETPVLIVFNGAAVNPTITNETTSEKIKVTTELLLGESLIIDTRYGNKSVTFVSGGVNTSAYNLVTNDSAFFQLKQGENVISFDSDSLEATSVSISYRNRFVGL